MVETKEKTIEKECQKKPEKKKKVSKTKNVITFIKESRKFLVAMIIGVVVVSVAVGLLLPNERTITTIAESSLKEAVETSELSTVEYIYNSTVTVLNDKNKPKYHVAYEGVVKAGFDINEITIQEDKENKKVVIIIPEIKINSVTINDKTLDFIFEKEKYDTETTFQEAYKASYEDLEKKAEVNESVKIMAYESAIDSMKAIIMPLESQLPDGYTFDFRKRSEAK